MKAAEKDILTAFLGKTLNTPTDEVAQLFVKNGEEFDFIPDASTKLSAWDAERVKAFKEEGDQKFLNGQKKATKELGTTRDKEIKEKFGLDSDKIGIELIEDLIQKKTDATTLDAEKVKAHPAFLAREKELLKQVTETEAAAKKKLEEFQQGLTEKEIQTKNFNVAKTLIKDEFKFALPENEAIANNQLKLIEDALKAIKTQGEGPDAIILKADGTRFEDLHGKPITLKTFVQAEAAKYWEVQTDGRSGTGAGKETPAEKAIRLAEEAKNGGAAAKKKWTGKIPSNDAEFSTEFAKLTSSEERVALADAFEASKQSV